jgi:manganese/zinc/iron transport system substrate-binding protein
MKSNKAILMLLMPMAILIFAFAGCGGPEEQAEKAADEKLNIVTTTGMITDIVKNVTGDRAEVIGLMGPGVDPHLYKASAGDVDRMRNADLIFYNGLHLEGAMSELFERMQSQIKTVAVTEGVDKVLLLSPPEFEGQHDPHLWFDVSLWMEAVRQVEKTMVQEDSVHADHYRQNAAAHLHKLEELDSLVHVWVEEVPEDKRTIITAHDAFNYLGRAYGFEVMGLQGISTATEAGTRDVQKLSDYIVEKEIPAIFVESSVPRRAVEALQEAVKSKGFSVEIGGELFSDAMGDPGTPEGTYIGMVKHNIRTIVDALSGKALEKG